MVQKLDYSASSSSSLVHFRVLPLKIKLIENDIKLGNLCTHHLHARLVAVDSCMSHWISPQPCRCKIKFWPPPPIEYRPGVNIQWIFRWIMTLLSYWILITLLNFDTFNQRSQFNLESQCNAESRPGVTIQRGIMRQGHNSTWNLDSGHILTWNHDPGSQFNVESWPGVTIQHWVMTRGHNSTWNFDPGSKFHVELRPGS